MGRKALANGFFLFTAGEFDVHARRMWAGAAETLLDAAEVGAGTRVLDVGTEPGSGAASALSGVPKLWQWTLSRAWWRLRQTYGLSRTGIKGTPKPLYASGEVVAIYQPAQATR